MSTFERNGRQYVVALSAGSFFPGTTRGDSVWLFALDGAGASGGASAQPSGAARSSRTSAGTDLFSGVRAGTDFFLRRCAAEKVQIRPFGGAENKSVPAYALGMTFAFSRNRLVGSYRFFSATSRE